jgi:hypothetical protein
MRPVQLAAVRDADAARRRGRAKLRRQSAGEQSGSEIPMAPVQNSNNSGQQPTKALK